MKQNTLLKFPDKVYLSGADCFHLMLDINAKKYNSGNNVVRIVFYFDNEESINSILYNVKRSPIISWFCNITLTKGFFFQKPYWKYNDGGNTIQINEHDCENDKVIPEKILNRGIDLKNKCLIEFDRIRYTSGKTAFILSWHHILMDGRGSGMLIRHLSNNEITDQKTFSGFFPTKEKKIPLLHYIKTMYEVKKFIENSSKAPIVSVLQKKVEANATFRIKTLHFNLSETEKIDSNAKNNGSKFGANVFLISCCAHIVHAINKHRKKTGTIWLPIPYDGRRRGGFGPIVTNCISFLFYRLPETDLISVKATVQSVSNQMAEQIKIEMPKKYNTLLNMMRYLPMHLYHFLVNRSGKGVVSSFLYTSAGEDMWDMNTLMNNPINDILIIPPLTFPPGLTFSFLRHNNTLKMNIVYCENTINNNELTLIESKINEILIGNY